MNSVISRLAASDNTDAFQLEDIRELLLSGDGNVNGGFQDDSIVSILRRCRRIKIVDASVSFLYMTHYIQLVCKCTR